MRNSSYIDRSTLIPYCYKSSFQALVQVTSGAGDKALPDIVIAGLDGPVTHAWLGFMFACVRNTNAALNKLDGAQNIQFRLAGGAWVNAIAFVDDMFRVAASSARGGLVAWGAIDLAAYITGDGTYNCQWDAALSDQDNLEFDDIQMLLGLWVR